MNKKDTTSKRNNNRGRKGTGFRSTGKEAAQRACVDSNAIRIDRDPSNDVSWYTKNPQLLKDSASLSFFNPLGQKYPLKYYSLDSLGYTDTPYQDGIPGIIAIHLAPTIGISTSAASSANVAARNIYSYVRHANSGHTNYEAPDLFMYLMAVSSAYSYYAHLCRAYGVLRYYNQKNKYLPTTMIRALGFIYNSADSSSLDRLAQLRQKINYLGVKLRSLYVPNTMSYFIRQMWCYTGVYKDAPADKSQLYVYVPEYVYKWSSTGSVHGTSLQPVWMYDEQGLPKYDLTTACNVMQQLIDQLLTDEDAGIMGGDLLKAYGQDKMFQLRELSEDYTVVPAFSEEVLNQIHNASIMGISPRCLTDETYTDPTSGVKFRSDFKVTQDENTGYIVFNPSWRVDASASTSKGFALEDIVSGVPFALAKEQYLDLSYEDATPERIMTSTRLMTCAVIVNLKGASMDKDNYLMGVTGCGSEIATRAELFSVTNERGDITTVEGISFSSTMYYNSAATIPVSAANNLINIMNMLGYFALAPHVYTGMANDSRKLFSTGMCGDLYNFTVVNFQELNRMHDAAVLSEFDVPVS